MKKNTEDPKVEGTVQKNRTDNAEHAKTQLMHSIEYGKLVQALLNVASDAPRFVPYPACEFFATRNAFSHDLYQDLE